MNGQEERQWIARCQSGDREAFGPIVRAYMKRAYFTALGMLGDSEEAYDISQEAFVRAFRAIRGFDASHDFAPWFFRILRNLCLTALAKRRARSLESLEEMAEAGREPRAGDRFRPDLLAERGEAVERVWRGLDALDPKSREVIVLKDLEGYRYREIAEILGVPIGTVMSRLFHARQKLKEKLMAGEGHRAV
ncbi:MAG: sigma-70 family RNA polymerase sigma factor [Candidatus Eisenbacteria bacterium]